MPLRLAIVPIWTSPEQTCQQSGTLRISAPGEFGHAQIVAPERAYGKLLGLVSGGEGRATDEER